MNLNAALSGFLSRLDDNGGDLDAAGAYDRSTLRALARTIEANGMTPVWRKRLGKRGVPEPEITRLLATVERHRRGRQIRLIPADRLVLLPEPEWLVASAVPAGALVVLYGAPGTFKSFLALDLAASVATGTAYLDRKVKAGVVVYVAGEDYRGMRDRVRAWKAHHDIRRLSRLRFVDQAVNLVDDLEEFLSRVREVNPVLVIFDTLSRSMPGLDENSSGDMGRVIAAVDRIREQTGAAVVLVHHSGKDPKSLERGSSALRAAADTMLAVTTANGVTQLSCEKQRDGASFGVLYARLVRAGRSLVPVVSEPPVPARSEDVGAIVGALREAGKPLSQRQLIELVPGTDARIREALKRAAADPDIPVRVAPGPRNSLVYSLAESGAK